MSHDATADDGPTAAKVPRVLKPSSSEKRLIVVLENSSLEVVKNGKNFELLNCDDHKQIMRKHGRDPATARPDITHKCLLMLMDSPLNRAGLLQVYIHTEKNALIEVNPQTRIPRTFTRFAGLMVQLLHKLSIHAANGNIKLLKVIKNPVSDHFPAGCRRFVSSYAAERCVCVRDFAATTNDEPVVFVVGAMSHGKVSVDYGEEEIGFSEYPLSAALACAKLTTGYEEAWGIS